MDFRNDMLGRYLRIIAIIALLLGLSDAARLLGIGNGQVSPLTSLGASGFAWLSVFALSRLFAAVGLWIRASWGAVLLAGATGVELALYVAGNPDIRMSAFGFAVRLVLLVSIVVIFALGLRQRRARD